jgi:hypothetical protein
LDVKEIGWKNVDLIQMAQDKDKLWAVLNTVMNIRVPQDGGDFLAS